MNITVFIIVAVVVVAVINAIIEVVKRASTISSRYLPILSIVVGVVVVISLKQFVSYDWYTLALVGFVLGLIASGVFDVAKVIKDAKKALQAAKDVKK